MTENIELAVYAANDLTTVQEVISRRTSPTLLEEHNKPGGGSFKIQSGDELLETPGLLAEGKIIGVKVRGRLIGYWEIKKINTVLIDVNGRASEFKEFSGPSVRDWLAHAIVMQWPTVTSGDDRYFNFAAPRGDWYKAAEWKAPVVLGAVRTAQTPKGWPEQLNASWVWNATGPAAAGDVYMRREFTTTAEASYRMIGTAGDYMAVLIDGVRVFSVTEFGAVARTFSADFTLPAGDHVLAIRARKAQNSSTRGVVGMAMLRIPETDDSVEDSKDADRILWTGDSGGWVMNAYPKTPPGFTIGGVLLTLLDEARRRSVDSLARMRATFTATADSYGNAWPGTVDPSFKVGATLQEVVAQITDTYADVWVDSTGGVNMAVQRGRDLSTGDDPITFRRGLNVLGAATESTAEIANTVFVKSGSGIVETVGPAASVSKYGRRETFLSAVNASSDGSVPYLVKQLFDKYAEPRRTPTLTIHPTDASIPFEDFNVGDWVLAPSDEDAATLIRRRVVSIAVGEDPDTGLPVYTVELDTIQETLENRLARWLEELGNGSMSGGVSGTSSGTGSQADIPTGTNQWTGTTPLNPRPSAQTPTPPSNVRATADVVRDAEGLPVGRLLVDWQHDGFDVKGKAVVGLEYDVFGRIQGSGADYQRLMTTSELRATIPGLPNRRPDGGTLVWEVYVTASSPGGRRSGKSSIVATEMKKDLVAPLQPSMPKLAVRSVAITVTWDFKDLNGEGQPVDFAYAVVQHKASTATDWNDVGIMLQPADKVVFQGAGYGTQHVRLIAVDDSGNRSVPSAVAMIDTTKLVDADLILSEIDAGKTKIKNAAQILLDAQTTLSSKLEENDSKLANAEKAISGAGGLTERLGAAETKLKDVGALTLADGVTLTKKLSDNATAIETAKGDLTKLADRVSPVETAITKWNETTLPALQGSIDGKTRIVRATGDAPTSVDGYREGDRWEKWSTLNAGGKLLKAWRVRGTIWTQELMDPTYLPLVDIGEGTFGSLAGGRITAGSIGTPQLMVGSFSNLLENGSFEYGAANWPATANWTVEKTGGRLSPGCLRVTNINARLFGPTSSNRIPVESGDSYRLSGWVRTTATTNATRGELCLYFYRGDGSFLSNTNFNIDDATADWKYYSKILKPPADAATMSVRINATLGHVAQEYFFDDIALVKASDGSLTVNGSITGDHVDAETVGAKVGQFVKADIANLTVTGTANLQSAVADRIFTNLFATRKLYAESVLIGSMSNSIPDPLFTDPEYVRRVNSYSTCTVALSADNDLALTGTTAATWFRPLGQHQSTTGYKNWIAVQPGQKWRFDVEISQAKVAGYITLIGRTQDGSAYASPVEKTNYAVGSGKYSVECIIPANCYWMMPEMQVPANAGTFWVKRGSMVVREMITPELIVEGGVTAKHITASESLSAKVGQFLTVGVEQLTVTGTANMKDAVADRVFSNLFSTRRLTANQVYIGEGGNLFPALLNDPAWTQTAGFEFSASGGKTGGASIRMPASASQTGTYFAVGSVADRQKMPRMVAGATYRIRANVRGDGIIAKNGAAIYVRLYGETGTGYTWVTPSVGYSADVIPANTWGSVEFQFSIPEDSNNLYLGVGLYSQTVANVAMRWSDLTVQEVVTVELVVDGAITTKKLAVTEDMTVELLKAHKVLAAEINTNSLAADTAFIGAMRTGILTADVIKSGMVAADAITAESLKADAITAKHTITGALHRTAASGARTEMTKDGLRVLNASGIEQVKLGYGLETGLAVLNPFTNKMTALQNHVFGTQYLEGTFKSSNSDNGGVAGMDTPSIARVLKNSSYQDLTFTAYSDKVTLVISFSLRAWLASGLTTNTSHITGSAVPKILGASGVTEPPYQGLNQLFDYNFSVPYAMVAEHAFTIVHTVTLLEPGKKYRLQMDFDNHDRDTVHSRIYWAGCRAVVMPN